MSQRAAAILLAGLVCCVGVAVWWFWPAPAVVAFDNLKYIQLLRTACSSQRVDYLEGVERAILQRREQGMLSDPEWAEFQKILATARTGNWRQADLDALRLEQAQLSRRRVDGAAAAQGDP